MQTEFGRLLKKKTHSYYKIMVRIVNCNLFGYRAGMFSLKQNFKKYSFHNSMNLILIKSKILGCGGKRKKGR